MPPDNRCAQWNGYSLPGILMDSLQVECLMNTSLVSYYLGPEEMMKKLFQLSATIDENASEAFIELKKLQQQVCPQCVCLNCFYVHFFADEEGLWGDD